MSDIDPTKYFGLMCRHCGQIWIFEEELVVDEDGILNCECPFCRDYTDF